MIRSEVRAQVAANQAGSVKSAEGADGQAAEAVAAAPSEANRLGIASGLPRAPWLVRNSRKATIALVLAILAASPFAYLYLRDNFGPDPLRGIKLDGVKIDPLTGLPEIVAKPAAIWPLDAKSSLTRPAATSAPVEPAPKTRPPEPFASPARPVATVPAAPALGVTHTRPAVAPPVKPEAAPPVAAISGSQGTSARPRENVREEPTVSGVCNEAVAALGLCNTNATEKAK
jgi:hypothetical protein